MSSPSGSGQWLLGALILVAMAAWCGWFVKWHGGLALAILVAIVLLAFLVSRVAA